MNYFSYYHLILHYYSDGYVQQFFIDSEHHDKTYRKK